MVGPEAALTMRAFSACKGIDDFIESGHLIRALVELRALLEAEGYWDNPDRESLVRTAYLKSVDGFAARGVSESELRITLRA